MCKKLRLWLLATLTILACLCFNIVRFPAVKDAASLGDSRLVPRIKSTQLPLPETGAPSSEVNTAISLKKFSAETFSEAPISNTDASSSITTSIEERGPVLSPPDEEKGGKASYAEVFSQIGSDAAFPEKKAFSEKKALSEVYTSRPRTGLNVTQEKKTPQCDGLPFPFNLSLSEFMVWGKNDPESEGDPEEEPEEDKDKNTPGDHLIVFPSGEKFRSQDVTASPSELPSLGEAPQETWDKVHPHTGMAVSESILAEKELKKEGSHTVSTVEEDSGVTTARAVTYKPSSREKILLPTEGTQPKVMPRPIKQINPNNLIMPVKTDIQAFPHSHEVKIQTGNIHVSHYPSEHDVSEEKQGNVTAMIQDSSSIPVTEEYEYEGPGGFTPPLREMPVYGHFGVSKPVEVKVLSESSRRDAGNKDLSGEIKQAKAPGRVMGADTSLGPPQVGNIPVENNNKGMLGAPETGDLYPDINTGKWLNPSESPPSLGLPEVGDLLF